MMTLATAKELMTPAQIMVRLYPKSPPVPMVHLEHFEAAEVIIDDLQKDVARLESVIRDLTHALNNAEAYGQTEHEQLVAEQRNLNNLHNWLEEAGDGWPLSGLAWQIRRKLEAVFAVLTHKEPEEKKQMTLGQLIERLSALPVDQLVNGLCCPHYHALEGVAFIAEGTTRARELAQVLRAALGKYLPAPENGATWVVPNYDTPVWATDTIHRAGCRVMDFRDDGTFEFSFGH